MKEIDDLERPFKDYAEAKGWIYEKVSSLSRNGWPDRFLLRNGRVVLLEWKAPGKEPTRQQYIRQRQLRQAGAEVVWFNDLEAAKAYFV